MPDTVRAAAGSPVKPPWVCMLLISSYSFVWTTGLRVRLGVVNVATAADRRLLTFFESKSCTLIRHLST